MINGWFKRKQLKGIDVDTTRKTTDSSVAVGSAVATNLFPEEKLKLGTTLAIKASMERVNQVESRPLDEDDPFSEEIKGVLINSDFQRIRKKVASDVFHIGMVWCMWVPFNGSFILDAWTIIEYDRIGSIFTRLRLMTSTNVVVNGVPIPLQAEMEYKNGTTSLQFFYEKDTEEGTKMFAYKDSKTFKTSSMLGAPMRANYQETGEIQAAGLDDSIKHLDYLSQLVSEESMRTRTLFEINSNFTDFANIEDFEKALRKGGSGMMSEAFNQKIQSGLSIPVSGSQSQTFSQIAYSFVEDKIKEQLGLLRDSTNTGAQKHTLEITLQNQTATEMLWSIKDIREKDYKALIKTLCEVLNIPDESEKVKLKLSLIEELKIRTMEEKLAQEENKGSLSPKRLETGKNG